VRIFLETDRLRLREFTAHDVDLRRVFAETMAVNTASRRMMEKSGLTYDWRKPRQAACPVPVSG
jgi:RimJ/RimL family protein N-acetyltransferase